MSSLVVTRLLGGLGNQLFQWAAGTSIARQAGAAWMIDERMLAPGIPSRFEQLGIAAPVWRGSPSVERLLRVKGLWRLCRATGWQPRLARTRLAFDRLRGFIPTLPARVPRDGTLILVGYWQAPEWVASIESTARAALPAPIPSEAIGIHVRRGDYQSDPRVARVHDVVDPDYYRRAIDALGSEARERPILLFSNEPTRVLAEGWLPPTARAAPAGSDIDHLRLMAGCAHLIGANSTFAWWAGWLGERPGRTVTVPARWWSDALGAIPHPAPASWRRW